MKRLTYLSVAESELIEAPEFYEQQEPGLGKDFLDAIRAAGERIRRDPHLWPYYEKPVCGYRVLPYPYRLLYRDFEDRVQIVAVFHLSRHPGSWRDRLR